MRGAVYRGTTVYIYSLPATDRVFPRTEFSHGPSSPADRVHSYSSHIVVTHLERRECPDCEHDTVVVPTLSDL